MKTYIFFFSLFFISCDDLQYYEKIYGIWHGNFNDESLEFRFKKNNTCVLKFLDLNTGKVKIFKGNFEIQSSKNPVPLSIRNINNLDHPLYTIIEFEEINIIKLAIFSPRWRLRPISFESDNLMRLERANLNLSHYEKIR